MLKVNIYEVARNLKLPNSLVKNAICAFSFEESSAILLNQKEIRGDVTVAQLTQSTMTVPQHNQSSFEFLLFLSSPFKALARGQTRQFYSECIEFWPYVTIHCCTTLAMWQWYDDSMAFANICQTTRARLSLVIPMRHKTITFGSVIPQLNLTIKYPRFM